MPKPKRHSNECIDNERLQCRRGVWTFIHFLQRRTLQCSFQLRLPVNAFDGDQNQRIVSLKSHNMKFTFQINFIFIFFTLHMHWFWVFRLAGLGLKIYRSKLRNRQKFHENKTLSIHAVRCVVNKKGTFCRSSGHLADKKKVKLLFEYMAEIRWNYKINVSEEEEPTQNQSSTHLSTLIRWAFAQNILHKPIKRNQKIQQQPKKKKNRRAGRLIKL